MLDGDTEPTPQRQVRPLLMRQSSEEGKKKQVTALFRPRTRKSSELGFTEKRKGVKGNKERGYHHLCLSFDSLIMLNF